MTDLVGGAAASSDGAPGASPTGSSSAPAIELKGIVKRFPGVVANDGIDLAVAPGSIHAVVGENGAGKSTLMKILYGEQRPDEGSILVRGVEQSFKSPRDAIAVGIGMVHQHVMLADNLTVEENVILGDEPGSPFRIDFGKAADRITELGRVYGLPVNPETLVAELGVGDRQRVEILKVLYRGARILILDEPTAVLVPQEVDELFASLRELTSEGVTIIFISHKLDEVLAVADAITVVRAGRTVGVAVRGDGARARGADGRERAAQTRDPRVDGHRRRRARSCGSHRRRGRAGAARPGVAHSASRRGRRRRRRRGQRPA